MSDHNNIPPSSSSSQSHLPSIIVPNTESTVHQTENVNKPSSPRAVNNQPQQHHQQQQQQQQPSSPRPTNHNQNNNNTGNKSPNLNTSTGVNPSPNKNLNTSTGVKSPNLNTSTGVKSPNLNTSTGSNTSTNPLLKNNTNSPIKSPSLNTSTSSDLLSNHHNHSLINYHNQQQHHHHYPSLNQTQEQHQVSGGLPPLHHRLHTHDPGHPNHYLHHGNNTLSESTEINLLNESFGKTGAVLTTGSSSGSLGHSRGDLSASTMMKKKQQPYGGGEGISPLLKNSQAMRSSQISNPFRMSQSLKGSQSLRASTASWIRGSTASWINPLKFSVTDGHMVLASSHDIPLTPQEESEILASQEIAMSDMESIKEVDEVPPYEKDGAEQEDDLKIQTIDSRWKLILQKLKAKEGLLFMVFSAFLFSIMSLLVKIMSSGMQSMELAFIRSFYGLIGCLIILYILKENPFGPKQHRVFLTIRGLSGTLSLCAYFYTVSVLPLSLAVVVSFTSPVITAAMAAVILKEKWGKFEALCAFLSLAGVVIVSKPAFLFPHHPTNANSTSGSTSEDGGDSSQLLYILIGVAGAVFSALSFIAVRKIGRGVNPFVLVFYFSLVACIITLPGSFILQSFVWPDWATWGWLTLLGVVAVVAQGAVNRGIQLEKAAKAAAMNYLQIIFTFIWELSFLGGSLDLITIIGTLLILSCAAVTAFKK